MAVATAPKNNNREALNGLPWETLLQLFPTAYIAIIGQRWVIDYVGHRKDKNHPTAKPETYCKGHWETTVYPQKFRGANAMEMAWETAKGRFTGKGEHAPKLKKVIPELDDVKVNFNNVIMSDR